MGEKYCGCSPGHSVIAYLLVYTGILCVCVCVRGSKVIALSPFIGLSPQVRADIP